MPLFRLEGARLDAPVACPLQEPEGRKKVESTGLEMGGSISWLAARVGFHPGLETIPPMSLEAGPLVPPAKRNRKGRSMARPRRGGGIPHVRRSGPTLGGDQFSASPANRWNAPGAPRPTPASRSFRVSNVLSHRRFFHAQADLSLAGLEDSPRTLSLCGGTPADTSAAKSALLSTVGPRGLIP